jgi:hypothetical protein
MSFAHADPQKPLSKFDRGLSVAAFAPLRV